MTVSGRLYDKVKNLHGEAFSFNLHFGDSNCSVGDLKYLHIALVSEVVLDLTYIVEFGKDATSYSNL